MFGLNEFCLEAYKFMYEVSEKHAMHEIKIF